MGIDPIDSIFIASMHDIVAVTMVVAMVALCGELCLWSLERLIGKWGKLRIAWVNWKQTKDDFDL